MGQTYRGRTHAVMRLVVRHDGWALRLLLLIGRLRLLNVHRLFVGRILGWRLSVGERVSVIRHGRGVVVIERGLRLRSPVGARSRFLGINLLGIGHEY